MVASVRGYTPNYSFKLVNFDTPRWHTLEYANWTQLDAMLLQAGIPQIRGDWTYATTYFVGDRVMDNITGTLYRCLVEHISATTGTFEDDRLANPTYWTVQTFGVPLFRDFWQPDTVYALGDIVVYPQYAYYLCIEDHHSGATFLPDALYWTLVFDATATVDAAEAAADASLDSADDSAASALAASISAIEALNSANSADASEAAAAASAITAAEQASKLWGTSTTAVDIGIGLRSFITQADKYFEVGKFVMVRDVADPINRWMWGQVNTYTTTSLVIDARTVVGAGVSSNWMIDVSGAQGAPGPTGSGTGDMLRINNLSDVMNTSVARNNLGLGNSATLHVGTTVNTVMAGDDGRVVGGASKIYVDNAIATSKVYVDNADALKAPLDSPVFINNPRAPTPLITDDDTSIATTEFVKDAIAAALAEVPEAVTIVSDTRPDPATTPSGSTWWESDTGNSYTLYDDGTSKQWVEDGSGGSDAVLYNTVQALTTGQQTQARANIGAVDQTYVDGADANTLKYTPQTLTAPEQAQARTNVGGIGAVKIQKFMTPGSHTYTPSPGMIYCIIEGVAGGGGGGPISSGAGGDSYGAGGGGGGGYFRHLATAAEIGASQPVIVGVAGAPGAAGAANGGNGGDTAVGATAEFGQAFGGQGGLFSSGNVQGGGGAGGIVGTGNIIAAGGFPGGQGSYVKSANAQNWGGPGGNSYFGGGGIGINNAVGGNAVSHGGGGAGSSQQNAMVQRAGSSGYHGCVIITEYCV